MAARGPRVNQPANRIGCPNCGTTVESTWWECPKCGSTVQGKWWKSHPGVIKRRGEFQSCLLLLAGMVCLVIAMTLLARDSGSSQPRTWQTFSLSIVFTFAGSAFLGGMNVFDWWYADKGPHDIIPFTPPDSEVH